MKDSASKGLEVSINITFITKQPVIRWLLLVTVFHCSIIWWPLKPAPTGHVYNATRKKNRPPLFPELHENNFYYYYLYYYYFSLSFYLTELSLLMDALAFAETSKPNRLLLFNSLNTIYSIFSAIIIFLIITSFFRIYLLILHNVKVFGL